MVRALAEHVSVAHEHLEGIAATWDSKSSAREDECGQLRSFFGQVRSLREACDAVLDLEAAAGPQCGGGDADTSSTGSWSEDETLSMEADAAAGEHGDSLPTLVQESWGHTSENDEYRDGPALECNAPRGMVPALDLSCISSDTSPASATQDRGQATAEPSIDQTQGTPATSVLSFTTNCSYTRVGQHLRVVGSCDTLGAWDPRRGLPLKTTAADFPLWTSTGTLVLDVDAVVEYKYVICDQGGGTVQWEQRPNRRLHLASMKVDVSREGSFFVVAEAFAACDEEGAAQPRGPTLLGPAVAALRTPRRPLREPPLFTPTTRRHRRQSSPGGLLQAPSPLWAREDSCSQLFDRGSGPEAPGRAFQSCYALLGDGPLAEGGFGLVWRCRLRAAAPGGGAGGPAEFAAKIINKVQVAANDPSRSASLQDEVRLHAELKHPNIVDLVEYFDEVGALTLVLEFCRGGDLFDTITAERARRPKGGGLSEPGAAAAGRDLLKALGYLHSLAVVHRDVKCENVLAERAGVPPECNAFKLCDFGFAARDAGAGLCGRVGSPDTVAPEVVGGKLYSCPADLWSAGVVLYMALAAESPFAGATDQQVLQRVLVGAYSLQGGLWAGISQAATRLVECLMTVSPVLRPTAARALQSEWLRLPGAEPFKRERAGDASSIANLLERRFSWTAAGDE